MFSRLSGWLLVIVKALHLVREPEPSMEGTPTLPGGETALISWLPRTVPYEYRERHKCPFAGFHVTFAGAYDLGSNRCLLQDEHHRCWMMDPGLSPDWNRCSEVTPPDAEQIKMIREGVALAGEFCPPKLRSVGWSGVNFGIYMDWVMSDQCPRPPAPISAEKSA